LSVTVQLLSLAIGLWITGSSWAVALIACLLGASTEWIFSLFMLGLLTGTAMLVVK